MAAGCKQEVFETAPLRYAAVRKTSLLTGELEGKPRTGGT